MEPGTRPVFLNESGRRAQAANAGMIFFFCVCALTLLSVLYVLIATPQLPQLVSTPSAERTAEPGTVASSPSAAQAVGLAVNRQVPKAAAQTLRFAYFPTNGPGAFASLKQHASELDAVIPDWLEIARTKAGIQILANEESIPVARWLRTKASNVAVYPEINSNLSSADISLVLAQPAIREKLISQISDYIYENEFRGVTVRLAGLPASSHNILLNFLSSLHETFKARQWKIITVVETTEPTRRIQELSRVSDFILLVTHENYTIGNPGPIAAQGWFESQIATNLTRISPSKFIVSIGSGGYDWDERGGWQRISTSAAWTLMKNVGATIRLDSRSLNPTFSYRDSKNHRHQVWFLDATTAFNQLKATLPYRPGGIAIGHLGLEDPGLWSFWGRNKLPDEAALSALSKIPPGYDLYSTIKAPLLSASPGSSGMRTISYNEKLGLIVAQSITQAPSQAVLRTFVPVDQKSIALTFDDGPDPTYTGPILDILAAKGAKATFYVVGRNALQWASLLRRIYAEGHDVGNHTFSHPSLMESGGDRISLELNATQRVLESQLGRQTILFRPPTAFSNLSYLDSSPQIIETATRLGYKLGHFDIESNDWSLSSKASVAGVVDRVVNQVTEGLGQIILMHDAGGNRQVTLDALPEIIDQLQAKGFRFVTTHELVGKTRDEIMPPYISQNSLETAAVQASGASLQTISWVGGFLPIVAITTSILTILRLIIIVIGATWHKSTAGRRRLHSSDGLQLPRVAVLVPAYNEETGIVKTIQTLLDSTICDRIEIVVIDDGSSDKTAQIVRENFLHLANVRLYTKPNGGKASALNYGIHRTDAEIIVAIDGDTVLLPDAVEHLVRHFANPRVGAVAGSVHVGNRINLITRFQALEYLMSQSLDRRAFELVNAIGVVPGAIGAWRRQALLEVGGYSADTLAEDADLTLSLQRRGWKIVCEPKALALTEAPESVKEFNKQRFRWMFGTLQVAYKHFRRIKHRSAPGVRIIVFNVFVFQFAFTLLAPLMDVILVWSLLTEVIGYLLYGPSSYNFDTSVTLATYWLIFQTFDLLAGVVAIVLNGKAAEYRLIPLLFLQRFCYRQLLYVVAMRALLAAIKGNLMGWGKLIRTGSVQVPVVHSGRP